MRAYVNTEPHLSTISRLGDWCDEATFVDWEQPVSDLPNWQTGFRHLVADGQSATLPHPSKDNESRTFPPPVKAK